MKRFVVITGFVFCAIPPAFAADMVPVYSQHDGKTYVSPVRPEPFIAPPIQQWVFDVGGRYWPSTGKSKLDLYVSGPSDLISRLTYTDLKSHSGEVFGRADHITGFFAKGYAGLGKINSGSLQDEDFPPFLPLYSSTYSEQQNGSSVMSLWTSDGDCEVRDLILVFLLAITLFRTINSLRLHANSDYGYAVYLQSGHSSFNEGDWAGHQMAWPAAWI